MICDHCGFAVFVLIEVVTDRYAEGNTINTNTEEWCLVCIRDYYPPNVRRPETGAIGGAG